MAAKNIGEGNKASFGGGGDTTCKKSETGEEDSLWQSRKLSDRKVTEMVYASL
jgi:hypothetical protein